MPLEMFQTEVVIEVVVRIVDRVCVFAENEKKARKEASTHIIKMDSNKLQRKLQEVQTTQPLVAKVVKVNPTLIAPQKGRKRPAITKVQKVLIKALLKENSSNAMILYTPGEGWTLPFGALEYHSTTVDNRTVIALRERGLIKPYAVDENERRLQQAIGTMEQGTFAFVLNMDELKKRKVYHDHVSRG